MYLIRKGKSDKGRLIVFAEVTEEKLSPALMTALSGIVCLVDPLQVKRCGMNWEQPTSFCRL